MTIIENYTEKRERLTPTRVAIKSEPPGRPGWYGHHTLVSPLCPLAPSASRPDPTPRLECTGPRGRPGPAPEGEVGDWEARVPALEPEQQQPPLNLGLGIGETSR